MLNNFIYTKKKSLFEEALNNGEVLDEAIVFIADTKEIWNHGTYFDCSTTNFEEILSNYVDKNTAESFALKSQLTDYVDKTTGQTISGLKTFTNHIVLNNQSRIRSNIDPGELKVTRTNDDKGFIIRVNKDSTDSILPLEILSTNGSASYQYNFPKKSGTVALGVKKCGQVINANLKDGLIDLGDGYVKTTYANLKSLRDNSRLIPGQKYRITDYKTTVPALSGISVANHQFDVIVDALTPNTLSETAHVTNSIHSIGEKIQDLFSWDMNPGNWQSTNVQEIQSLTDLSIYVLQGTRTINQAGLVKVRFTAVQEDPETNDICIGADLVKDGTVVSKDYHIGRINYYPWQEENNIYYLPVTEAGSYIIRYYVAGVSANFETNLKVTVEVYEGIDYFANSNLNSWEIKYCLDSDTNRFQWANIDPEINKGVIYYMKDDKGNECPYDFKNILFDNFYTFSYTVNGVLYDGTVKYQCYNNRILPTHNQDGVIKLNKNVFKNTSASSLCCFNTFGLDCENNTFGDSCASNTFGNYCKENTFGNSCLYNNFEDFCLSNSFGNYCQSNKFGVYCQSNTFGSYIIRITFGRQCINCKFVDGYDNILEACRMIELGDLCNGLNIKSFSAPSYSSNSWLQNIKVANGLSGDVGVVTLNDKKTLHVINNSPNSISSLYEDDWVNNISFIEENLNSKQDELVSGTNIKTINGKSILGGGNINIGGSITSVAGTLNIKDLNAVKAAQKLLSNNQQVTYIITDANGNYPSPNSPTVYLDTKDNILDLLYRGNGDALKWLLLNKQAYYKVSNTWYSQTITNYVKIPSLHLRTAKVGDLITIIRHDMTASEFYSKYIDYNNLNLNLNTTDKAAFDGYLVALGIKGLFESISDGEAIRRLIEGGYIYTAENNPEKFPETIMNPLVNVKSEGIRDITFYTAQITPNTQNIYSGEFWSGNMTGPGIYSYVNAGIPSEVNPFNYEELYTGYVSPDGVLTLVSTKDPSNTFTRDDVNDTTWLRIGVGRNFYFYEDYDENNNPIGEKIQGTGEIFNDYINNVAHPDHGHAEGQQCFAEGWNSHAEGFQTVAGEYGVTGNAHSEGNNTWAAGNNSHAEGINTVAEGHNSHAEGDSTIASNWNAHAEGYRTIASGNGAHAEGNSDGFEEDRWNIASGFAAHTEGGGTVASGNYAHAEGWNTTASGLASHAEGRATQSLHNDAHAEGFQTYANCVQSHAEGALNYYEGLPLWKHAVGIGYTTSNAQNPNSPPVRQNAHLILNDGKHYIYGIGGYEGKGIENATDLATVISSLNTTLGDINSILESIIGKAEIKFNIKSLGVVLLFMAQEGMTWLDYVNSDYNLGMFKIEHDSVLYNSKTIINSSFQQQYPTDIIENGKIYEVA